MLLFGLVSVQALVGILTLLLQVPMFWALLHQFGALVVLAVSIAHWRALVPRLQDRASAGTSD